LSAKNIITFRLANGLFGIEMEHIREILTYEELIVVPQTKEWVVGVMNVRGIAMPIIDLRIRFRTNLTPVYNEKSVIIAIKAGQNRLIGYMIDEIRDILQVEEGSITPQSSVDTVIDVEFVKGYVVSGSQTIVIFDPQKLISQKEGEELNKNWGSF